MQPDLVTLRIGYAILSQQLEQLDAHKQAKATEARLHQAEQDSPPSSAAPPEYAKLRAAESSKEGIALPSAEGTAADERQELLRTLASEVLYWREGLKVLRMAQLPKWRGFFKWQIEAQIETLQTEYARLRAECATLDG